MTRSEGGGVQTATDAPPKEMTVDLGAGITLELVQIPAGEFTMGPGTNDEVDMRHRVRITRAFYLGKYLVTQEQWDAVMNNDPSEFVAREEAG